jgi:accessory gene regulator B
LELIANKITDFFVRNGAAAEDDRDIYVYGLIVTFSHAIGLVITLLLGFLLAVPLKLLIFFAMFTALRVSSGGYHAGSFWKCTVVSLLMMFAVVIVIRFTPGIVHIPLMFALSIASILIVFRFAPVAHENRPLSADEVKKFRERSRLVVLGCVFISLLFLIFGSPSYSFCGSLGIGVSAGSTLAAFLKQFFGGTADEKR